MRIKPPPGRRICITFAALFSLLLFSPETRAGEPPDLERARALFKEAELSFKLGEFEKALPLYKEAYRARALPAFLFNIGQCHRYMGQCQQAKFFFRQYLAAQPDSPHAAKVRGVMESCKANQAKPTPVKPAEPVKPDDPVKPDEQVEQQKARGDGDDSGKLRAILKWSGAGLGAALLVTGAVTGGLAYDRSQTFKDPTTPYEDLKGLEDSGKTLRAVAIVSLAVGGAAAVGAGLVHFLYPEESSAPAVALTPLPSGGAITLGGRF